MMSAYFKIIVDKTAAYHCKSDESVFTSYRLKELEMISIYMKFYFFYYINDGYRQMTAE